MTKSRKITITLLLAAVMVVSLLAIVACDGNKTIESIEITTAPTKTDYVAGEKFDPTGMVVSIVYEGGKKSALSAKDYTYAPSGALSTNNRNITITYEKDGALYKATQAINVHNALISATLKSNPSKLEYMVGERFDPAGMVVSVIYENGDHKDIEITESNAKFKTDPLEDTDTSITVTYYTYNFTVELDIIGGVYIEAEDGIINSSRYEIKNDSVDANGKNTASGGYYIGNMFANDSVTFVFNSDKEGVGNIAFRLASLYLKKDNGNWGPIWIGDCQFNRICKFSVNGVDYQIDDSVILPGGGSEDGEVDYTLWTNWKEVEFTNIHFREGRNEITLTFIPHTYTDTAQGSFSGSFTANIDSLKVTSVDCNVTSCKLAIDSITVKVANFVQDNGSVYLKLEGDVEYTGYTENEIEKHLEKDIYFALRQVDTYCATESALRTATVKGNNFALLVDISSILEGRYTVYFGNDEDTATTLKLGFAGNDGDTATRSYKSYTLSSKTDASSDTAFKGNLGITIVPNGEITTYQGTAATLELRDGAPCLVVKGTVEHTFDDAEHASVALNDEIGFEIQHNGPNWAYYLSTSADRKIKVNADGTFELIIDISSLAIDQYITHMGPGINANTNHYNDFQLSGEAAPNGLTIKAGAKKYTLISGNSNYYNCVGILVESIVTCKATGASIAAENDKAVVTITGTYATDESLDDDVLITFIKTVMLDLEGNPHMKTYYETGSTDNWNGNWSSNAFYAFDVILGENGTFTAKYDVTDLNSYCYTGHFGGSGGAYDLKPSMEQYNVSITIGDKVYTMIYEPNGGNEAFYGCVGLYIHAA